jgi:hypothetical protein
MSACSASFGTGWEGADRTFPRIWRDQERVDITGRLAFLKGAKISRPVRIMVALGAHPQDARDPRRMGTVRRGSPRGRGWRSAREACEQRRLLSHTARPALEERYLHAHELDRHRAQQIRGSRIRTIARIKQVNDRAIGQVSNEGAPATGRIRDHVPVGCGGANAELR